MQLTAMFAGECNCSLYCDQVETLWGALLRVGSGQAKATLHSTSEDEELQFQFFAEKTL